MATKSVSKIAGAVGGKYAVALKAVLAGRDKAVKADVEVRKNTIATRKAALRDAVATFDPEVLVPLQQEMQDYVDSMAEAKVLDRPLTAAEAYKLMEEHDRFLHISEFLATRREAIRASVFASVNEQLKLAGVEDYTNTSGEIKVPELGRVFKREGAGYSDPTLDEAKLANALAALDEDLAKSVFVEREIPAVTVVEMDTDKLMEIALGRPEVMELIRDHVNVGKEKTAKFVVRNYDPTDDE